MDKLSVLFRLRPLHQPHHIAAIEALTRLHPDLPQVGCFSTAFHSTQPYVATEFALPRKLTEEGIRRYGFHGLSYEYIASVRCGNLDPGVILYLLEEKGMTADAISDLLYNSSGLRGISGLSDDMKTLLESGRPEAAEAIDLFVYRIGRELGSLAAALGGLDASSSLPGSASTLPRSVAASVSRQPGLAWNLTGKPTPTVVHRSANGGARFPRG
jgi:acetate kinase